MGLAFGLSGQDQHLSDLNMNLGHPYAFGIYFV